jgi:hypothetical protein
LGGAFESSKDYPFKFLVDFLSRLSVSSMSARMR